MLGNSVDVIYFSAAIYGAADVFGMVFTGSIIVCDFICSGHFVFMVIDVLSDSF